MAASEHNQPICRREDAFSIVQTLQRAGHIAYFAGGCVRDMLWNLTPKDFDVATDAPPKHVRELFPKSQGVGQAFGVVLVRQQQSIIEVATFRADGSYSDGRRPDHIRFATPEEDAQRRDFTINGIFLDPVTQRVIDYVDGQSDLKSRTLRAIGDPAKRFAEDYLRLLRAVRFTARFDLNIEPTTADAILAHASKLPRIAPERICDELRATFTLARRSLSARLLDQTQITPVLLRGLYEPPASQSLPTRKLFAALEGVQTPFGLSLLLFTLDTLLHAGKSTDTLFDPDQAMAIARQLRTLFRLSNDETDIIVTAFDATRFLAGPMPSVAQMKRYLAREMSPLGQQLLRALHAAGHHTKRIVDLQDAFAAFGRDQIAPTPWVDGSDLQSLGFKPGPAFKRVLDAVYDAQLEARIAGRPQALDLARTMMEQA